MYSYLTSVCLKRPRLPYLVPSATVESYSKLKPVSMTESTITYGPFANVEAYSFDDMTVHYENNNAFLVVSRLERVLEVSMWGNILYGY